MSDVNTKKITAVKTTFSVEKITKDKSEYSGKEEKVFQVDNPDMYVAPGETVDILIKGEQGFTVYLPYAEAFNAQVFEAIENPYWAEEKSEAEMKAASGGADSAGKSTEVETTEEKMWGVRMTRIVPKDRFKPKKMAYCIYSKELDNFAVGNSPPTMKLDP